MGIVSSLGLIADDAIVLNDSNKLILRLVPCDVVARVAPVDEQVAEMEVELARRLAELGSPVVALEPRVEPAVHIRDGFAVTLWTYHRPATNSPVPASDYADALARLHAGMRHLDVATPHVTDRIEQAQLLLALPDLSPELPDAERALLAGTLVRLREVIERSGTREQLLHGEPHPGNLLNTVSGPLFVDLETCCRGPVEFDLAHAPDEVAQHYPGIDQNLLRSCRLLMLAMITTWRWDRGDHLPDGRRLAAEWLAQLRDGLARERRDD